MKKLSDADLHTAMRSIADWQVTEGKLHREFWFRDFAHAFGFMTISAMGIEKMNHHPEWCNVYNRVSVSLVTHDAGGITTRDIELAKLLDSVAAKLQ